MPIRSMISAKKPRHDEPPRLLLGDATGHQVEQLLVVEPTRRTGVSGTEHLAGLDLEVRHRVRPRTLGQQQVAVLLVRVGAGRGGADQHVADPHRAGAVALQRALVGDPAAAARLVVVDEQPVLEMLAGVGEVQPEHLRGATGPTEADRRRQAAPGRRRE